MFEILQRLTLATAANGAICGADVGSLWPAASVFVFTGKCVFEAEDGSVLAQTPLQWVAQLTSSDVRGVWLHNAPRNTHRPDHMGVAFANGGRRWIVETVASNASQLWEGFEHYNKARSEKSWETTYRQIASHWESRGPDAVSVESARTAMLAALVPIKRFAVEEGVSHFANFFESAIEALDAPPPTDDRYLSEILSFVELPREAKQLFASMCAAWVFGGMGSWNDRSFEGERETVNQELSATLFQRICESAVAIANCTFPQ